MLIQTPSLYPPSLDAAVTRGIPFTEMTVDNFKEYLNARFSEYEMFEAIPQTFPTLVETSKKTPGAMLYCANVTSGMVKSFVEITAAARYNSSMYVPSSDTHVYLFLPKSTALPN
jgi:hypothetical protein